jgi:tetratricopeptide (TPR) repeat protein
MKAKKNLRNWPTRVLLIVLSVSIPSPVLGQPLQGLLKSGLEKSNAGDFRGAITDLSRFIELFPTSAQAYHFRAEAKVGLQDFAGAVADSTKALELKPDLALAYTIRGNAKKAQGDLRGAAADLDKAAQLKSAPPPRP